MIGGGGDGDGDGLPQQASIVKPVKHALLSVLLLWMLRVQQKVPGRRSIMIFASVFVWRQVLRVAMEMGIVEGNRDGNCDGDGSEGDGSDGDGDGDSDGEWG